MKKTIGVIGLGIMGRAMAANVAKAGYPLVAFNRSAVTDLGPLKDYNFEMAPTPKAL